MATNSETLKIDGKEVPVSHLDKVLYPVTGFTKSAVIDYYIRVSSVLLPHLKDRPLTLKRYPEGVTGEFFYEKRCPPYRPRWVKTVSMWSEGKQQDIHYCAVTDLPSLVWAANLANLELHTFLSTRQHLNRPTVMVFDLDPGPPANILQCVQVGLWLRAALAKHSIECFPKTSGSKGLQIYVPLNTPVTFDQTKQFARDLAEAFASEHSELVVSKMTKSLRKGKVLIDWSQNQDHKTTVCAYSLRGRETPTVSTPVTWKELEQALKKKKPGLLVFDSAMVLARVKRLGDLFQPVLKMRQRLR